VHDKHALPDLLHGEEQRVYGDSAYASQEDLIASRAPSAKDFTGERVRNRSGGIDEANRSKNRNESKMRARVERVFAVVKRLMGLHGALSRADQERARAFTALAFSNIYVSRYVHERQNELKYVLPGPHRGRESEPIASTISFSRLSQVGFCENSGFFSGALSLAACATYSASACA
jgi:Transposase DDE domain